VQTTNLDKKNRSWCAFEALFMRYERSGRNETLLPRMAMQSAFEWAMDSAERKEFYEMILFAAQTEIEGDYMLLNEETGEYEWATEEQANESRWRA